MDPDSSREWHYELEGVKKGPVSERKLLADRELGLLEDSSLIWTSGLDDWIEFGASPLREDRSPADIHEEEKPIDFSDPEVTCAWSGETHKQSEMLPFGEVWIAPEHREAFVQHLAESGESPDIPLDGYPFSASLTFDTVLGQSFQIFGAQWREILILCACVYGPTHLVIEFMTRFDIPGSVLTVDDTPDILSLVQFGIWVPVIAGFASTIFIGSFVSAALFSMTSKRWNGSSAMGSGSVFQAGLQFFLKVFLTRLFLYFLYFFIGGIFGFVIIQGFDSGAFFLLGTIAFVIIAGLSVRLTSAEPLSVLLGQGGSHALGRSWELTRRNFWRVLGYRLVVLTPIGVISTVAGFILEIPFVLFQNFFAAALVTTLITVPTAFSSIFEMVLAIHLREKAEDSPLTPAPAPQTSI